VFGFRSAYNQKGKSSGDDGDSIKRVYRRNLETQSSKNGYAVPSLNEYCQKKGFMEIKSETYGTENARELQTRTVTTFLLKIKNGG
jgi:hypothetical protein